MSELSELVKQAANGDRAAFDRLYEQTKNGVWFTCIGILNNEENAKDIMQETYLAAFERLSSLEKPESVRSWLNRIAANKCKNHLGAKSNRAVENDEEVIENVPDDGLIPEEYVEDKAKRELIMRLIREALSEEQYQTVILYYFDELTAPEIAELMGVHEKTVRYRLKIAREKIKEAVSRYEDENGEKLHAVVPLLPISRLFGKASQNAAPLQIPTSTPTSPSNTAAPAAKTGGKAMLNTLKAKIIAGACAAAVVGGGVTAGVLIANNSKDKPENRPAYSAPANVSKPAAASKPSGTSKPESSTSKPTASQSDVPKLEGLKPIELLRTTGEFGENDPDIISGRIKDAYMTNNGSFILLTDDGELLLYELTYGAYAPMSFGKNTGITKFDSILFKSDNVDLSLTVVDGNNVFFKSVNSEGEVNLSRDSGNERAAQGVLFDGRAMRDICVGQYLEHLYVIDENGNGFMLENRYWRSQEYTNEKGVYAEPSECFFYYPDQLNSFIYNGMKLRQRIGSCVLAEDDKLYYHDPGHSDASETPVEELKDIDFESVFHSGSGAVLDCYYYAGVTRDGRITAFSIREDNDDIAHAAVAFSDNKPDGEVKKIWVSSKRIVVKTDKGFYYADYDEDNALKPLDALNNISEDVVNLRGNTVLLSNGSLYKITALRN